MTKSHDRDRNWHARITVDHDRGRVAEPTRACAAPGIFPLHRGQAPQAWTPTRRYGPATALSLADRVAVARPEWLRLIQHIGLGPGFRAGDNCHAVIETCRSHTLGRVLWSGETLPDSGQPEGDPRRVLRAPISGCVKPLKQIGEHCIEGEEIAEIQSSIPFGHDVENRKYPSGTMSKIVSPFTGVLRGLIHPRVEVTEGMKIGDIDPRDDSSICFLVSDKALSVGGGVLEAILIKLKEME